MNLPFHFSADPPIMGKPTVRRPRGGCLFKENLQARNSIFAFLSLLLQRHRGDLSFNLGTFDTSEIASVSKRKPGNVGFGGWNVLWGTGDPRWLWLRRGCTTLQRGEEILFVDSYKFCLRYSGKKNPPHDWTVVPLFTKHTWVSGVHSSQRLRGN